MALMCLEFQTVVLSSSNQNNLYSKNKTSLIFEAWLVKLVIDNICKEHFQAAGVLTYYYTSALLPTNGMSFISERKQRYSPITTINTIHTNCTNHQVIYVGK